MGKSRNDKRKNKNGWNPCGSTHTHTHTHTSSLLINNNRINIDKKDSNKA